ncbi:hypothetical protein [Enorma phocaeensis]|uniref:Uncharacterized protein n=1 Tax=Enorma phocaeensis TaxID=1871019 RepID=A0A921LRK2_9ACTN|nr:hypothetical protein [Enorma phocaeensis]HJG36273.1 hypothetical protein [Enorma phocaeensis]
MHELVFFDMTRWEITPRYRAGMTNYRAENADEDSLRKIKRGYYVEWRVADKHKMTFFDRMDLFVDTVDTDAPKILAGDAVRDGLSQIARRPFRLKPYFDPGVWGGQWMKRVCGLDPEYPIRFDFLDAVGGQNLVNAVTVVNEDEHVREEHTGLHELEFIETRRLWIEDEVTIDNGGSVNQLNLVEGERALVESLDGSFEPYKVHYAETFIVPAAVKGYRLVNPTGERIGVIRAYVRKPQA